MAKVIQVRTGIRVGCVGAGGTGKTTTAQTVEKALKVPFNKSASRIVYEELGLTEAKCAKLPDNEKYGLQFKIFDKKIELDKAFTYISDRTLLDHWAYCLMYCEAFIPDEQYFEFEDKVRTHMRTIYSHIFYFPFGYWFEKGDGVRQDHQSWQSAIDAIIVGYIHRWHLNVFEVPQIHGKEFRAQYVINTVKGAK